MTAAPCRQRKFDKMRAGIGNDEIAVRVEDRGAKATFDIALRGSRSPNLDELLDLKVRNFAIDLPGPDFVTTLCLDEAQIERRPVPTFRRLSVRRIRIRTRVVNEVSQATGLPASVVGGFFRDFATISITAVNVRRQTVKAGSNMGLVPTIVLNVGLGFPRRLFG